MGLLIPLRFSPKRPEEVALYNMLKAQKGKQPDTNTEGKTLMMDGLKYRALQATDGHPEVIPNG